ncbi:hypothetical protein HGP14_28550 [Rhizobium sp. P32RR-XVIII]|uniref:hypothetical protein n=1 Tax=Rhizobium sp. P32RR-XVIII TaxID=2726738 RepID=UPI001456BC78|nr:hypothetical protein [Rhizobium sp. P32RR-XVIII]NLS07248.1 hypothetical protein [Rhizobium sp. P32RR-XVIII]
MSSAITTQNLTDDNMNMLHGVLSDAGYTDDILLTQPQGFNLATKLMIRLFREGMTAPADLTIQLDRHFGIPEEEAAAYAGPLPRFAIQGLPADLRRTVLPGKGISTVTDESKTSHWQARHSGSLAPKTGKYLGDNPYNPKNDPVHFTLWREAYFKAQNQIDRFKQEDGGYRSL